MSEKEKSMLVSEVNILRELKHPNIVRYKVQQYMHTHAVHAHTVLARRMQDQQGA